MPRLFFPKGQMVPAQAELDRIAQRGAADNFYMSAVAEAHLQQPAPKLDIAANGQNAAAAADAKLVEAASFW
jgi:hypothetical protein